MPVLCTGGFQTASVIRRGDHRGDCDAVSIARPLIANNDLVSSSRPAAIAPNGRAPTATSACVNVVENPLGCYEESRYPSREAMVQEILSVFQPPAFA